MLRNTSITILWWRTEGDGWQLRPSSFILSEKWNFKKLIFLNLDFERTARLFTSKNIYG